MSIRSGVRLIVRLLAVRAMISPATTRATVYGTRIYLETSATAIMAISSHTTVVTCKLATPLSIKPTPSAYHYVRLLQLVGRRCEYRESGQVVSSAPH